MFSSYFLQCFNFFPINIVKCFSRFIYFIYCYFGDPPPVLFFLSKSKLIFFSKFPGIFHSSLYDFSYNCFYEGFRTCFFRRITIAYTFLDKWCIYISCFVLLFNKKVSCQKLKRRVAVTHWLNEIDIISGKVSLFCQD